MQEPHSFNRIQAVAQWQEELAVAAVSVDEARELESHLITACEDLERRGLTPEEAFCLARLRLGSVNTLAAEFLKLDPGRHRRGRLAWFTAGLLASYVGPTLLSLLSTLL